MFKSMGEQELAGLMQGRYLQVYAGNVSVELQGIPCSGSESSCVEGFSCVF